MSIKFKKQTEPATDSDRGQIYEDTSDNHIKIKNSQGEVLDLQSIAEANPFGENFQKAESLAISSTSSITAVNKVTLNTPVLSPGTYIVSWFYNWAHSATNSDFHGEINVDGTVEMQHIEEPTDTSLDQRRVCAGSIAVTFATTASHVIKIDYHSSSGDISRIVNARLMIWRAA